MQLNCQTHSDIQCKADVVLNYVNSAEIMPDSSERFGYSVYQPFNQVNFPIPIGGWLNAWAVSTKFVKCLCT